MYQSKRNAEIIANPRKTSCPNIERFIKETCQFCPGASTIAQDAFNKYTRFCKDKSIEFTTSFNVFARAFKYQITSANPIYGVGMFPANYLAYKEGRGYVPKQGWSYSNLVVNY